MNIKIKIKLISLLMEVYCTIYLIKSVAGGWNDWKCMVDVSST